MPLSIEVENVDFARSNGAAPAIEAKFFRLVSLKNSKIRGGRYGIEIPVGPTILNLDNVDLAHTNTGADQANLCNVNYIETVAIENSKFSSARR